MSTDWPHSDRQQIQRAREAAEALFKSKPESTPTEAPSAHPVAPTDASQPPHQPRILSVQTAAAAEAGERDLSADAVPLRRTKQRGGKVPESAHGRIRTLVTYGMEVEEVADLYEVPVSEIDRIIKLG